MEEQERGLETQTIAFMIATAIFFDVLQALLDFIFMGWLAGIFAGLTFWWWFKQHGIHIGFGKPKRLAFFGLTSIIEMFPILPLSAIPAWTAYVATLALTNKLKESDIMKGK